MLQVYCGSAGNLYHSYLHRYPHYKYSVLTWFSMVIMSERNHVLVLGFPKKWPMSLPLIFHWLEPIMWSHPTSKDMEKWDLTKCLHRESSRIFFNNSSNTFEWVTASWIVKTLILGPLIESRKVVQSSKFSLWEMEWGWCEITSNWQNYSWISVSDSSFHIV